MVPFSRQPLTSRYIASLCRVGVSAGEMSVTFLGNDEYRVYVELGPAIREVNEAEHLCGAGHIVLSPTAWELCTQSLYNHELLDDQQHARVGTEWLNCLMSLSLFKKNKKNTKNRARQLLIVPNAVMKQQICYYE